MNRRTFIKRSAAAGGGLLASGSFMPLANAARQAGRPNILVIMVDQMRTPQWFPDQAKLDALLPNIARIRSRATSFENHFTASNMCVPARGALLTGLYPHQTGCMLTKEVTSSTLSPRFPTWGTMLRQQGYDTTWWGKWHLGAAGDKNAGGLEPYGFDGGTYPSPNGNPGEGSDKDPGIVDQFVDWFANGRHSGPWCSTVSLVNPHDINWFPRFTALDEPLASVDYDFKSGPPNAETTTQLQATKPRLQRALQETTNAACGVVPDEGPTADATWARMLKLYLWYQQQVDAQIGRVLDTLAARPKVAANTVVIFTSDHGDHSGSHGLRTKGGGAYEEAIHVPLYISDPRNRRRATRRQLTSSVDLAPLLLTIAHGSPSWRSRARYEHLASRADLASIARHPRAKGRPWIAHVTDETTVEELSYTYNFANEAPHHVAAVRTASAKYAVYSRWKDGSLEVDPGDEDRELYDYRTQGGRRELENVAGRGTKLERTMAQLLDAKVIPGEVRKPLPHRLKAAQDEGLADFFARTSDATP
jgi:arylsulfatase A-like enzyme